MKILGIDPGLQRTGFAVVECEGTRLRYVASGTVSTLGATRRVATAAEIDLRRCGRGRAALPARCRVGGDRVRQRQPAEHAVARPARGARWRTGGRWSPWPSTPRCNEEGRGRPWPQPPRRRSSRWWRACCAAARASKDAADALGPRITHAHAAARSLRWRASPLARKAHAQYKRGRTY